MNWFAGLEQIVKTDVPLGPLTWFGIGGPAKYFVSPRTVEELVEVATRCREQQIPMLVLGDGANLLVADTGVNGAVVSLREGEAFTTLDAARRRVKVGAAFEMGKLVLHCIRNGLSGLEALAGIPGTVGGCVKMNAGGNFGDIGSAVECVTVMDEEGQVFQRLRDDLAFGYRSTNITSRFILSAEFRVEDDDPQRILKQVKQIWMYKKNTQPLSTRSAGCIFKNPRGMSAGALIDKAGLKGRAIGGAKISDKHANFIVTDKSATAIDVLKLIDLVRDVVAGEFGVTLEKEIEVW